MALRVFEKSHKEVEMMKGMALRVFEKNHKEVEMMKRHGAARD
jgi:hypothetical protein